MTRLLPGVQRPKIQKPPKRKAIDGHRMVVNEFLVPPIAQTKEQVRMMAFEIASHETMRQEKKENPATKVFIDGSPSRGIDKMTRTLDVFYGARDARPALSAVAGIVSGTLAGLGVAVSWRWLLDTGSGYGALPSGAILMVPTDKAVLVPNGPGAEWLSKANIDYKLGVRDGAIVRAPKRSGLLASASRKARSAVSPEYRVSMQWTNFRKSSTGDTSSGEYNEIREAQGVPTTAEVVQGVPIYLFRMNKGGSRGF